MTETSDEVKSNNVKLIYNYTENLYQCTSTNLASLDTRLATIIAFGGLLLRFSGELPADSWWQLILKVITGVSIATSTYVALRGYLSKPSGKLIKPKPLLNEWYYASDEECRLFITRERAEAIEEVDALRIKKSQRLNLAITLLVVSIALFGFSFWTADFFDFI